MDITSLIKSVDFITLMEHYGFEKITEHGDKIRACCKIHGGDSPTSFEVNTEENLWYCHSHCKIGGNPINLVQAIEHIDFLSAIKRMCQILKIDVEGIKYEQIDDKYHKEAKKFFASLKSEHSFDSFHVDNLVTCPIQSYRGVKNETLGRLGVEFCRQYPFTSSSGEKLWLRDRVIFPITFNGKVVGHSLRSTNKSDKLRWIHAPYGLKKSHLLYNYDVASDYIESTGDTTLIVVEGIMDAVKIVDIGYDNVVAILGSSISQTQINLMMKISTNLILMFDGDEAGRQIVSQHIKELSKKFNVFTISLPENRDPGDIESSELKKILEDVYEKIA